MKKTLKELKITLAKLEALSERFVDAGFDAQADQLDDAVEAVEELILDLEKL